MIPFFRKIRKKMAFDNRPMKYLRYAIGEIVLVVIGILIAFQVNTWNEKRKNDLMVNTILKQVHTELAVNIKRSNQLVLHYKKRDSIIRLIMNTDLEDGDYENFRNRKSIMSSEIFEIKDKAYEKISLRTSNSSSYLDSLITDLNELYISKKEEVDWSNDLVDKTVLEYFEWNRINSKWFADSYFRHRKISDEEFNFHKLDNVFYKNHVYNTYSSGLGNHYRAIMKFRNHAIKTYRGLSKKLNLKENEIDPFSIQLTVDETQQVLGNYIHKQTTDTLKIFKENNVFYYKTVDNGIEEISFINKTFFVLNTRTLFFRTFDFDKNENVTGFNLRSGSFKSEWKKVN